MEILNREKKILIVLLSLSLLVITGTRVAAQQQPFNYTQYMDNLTPFNPAYSMLDKAGSINTLASKQLVGINGGPTTFLLNGDLPIESINSSAGLIVLSDQLAIEQETEVNAYFAKAIQLGEKCLFSSFAECRVKELCSQLFSSGPKRSRVQE